MSPNVRLAELLVSETFLMSKYAKIESLLVGVETELRNMQLWSEDAPSEDAMRSVEPFCIDTMNFPTWLQFIFLPRMSLIIEQQIPLPASCSITPMAEEYFAGKSGAATGLITALKNLDQAFSDE